jgi:hypothetical protein
VYAEPTALGAYGRGCSEAEDGEVREVRCEDLGNAVDEVVLRVVWTIICSTPYAFQQRVRPELRVQKFVPGVYGELVQQRLVFICERAQLAQTRKQDLGFDLEAAFCACEHILGRKVWQAEREAHGRAHKEQVERSCDFRWRCPNRDASRDSAGRVEGRNQPVEKERSEDHKERVHAAGEKTKARYYDVGKEQEHAILPVEHVGNDEYGMECTEEGNSSCVAWRGTGIRGRSDNARVLEMTCVPVLALGTLGLGRIWMAQEHVNHRLRQCWCKLPVASLSHRIASLSY